MELDKCWLSVKWLEVPTIDWYGPFETIEELNNQYAKLEEDSGSFIEWVEASWQGIAFNPWSDIEED